jgi:hypothetical protein
MAVLQDGYLTPDQNLGTVAVTTQPGAIQIDIVMRMNRADYLLGKSPIECLSLEDRYIPALVQGTGQTRQQALGYQPANFIDIADIQMIT